MQNLFERVLNQNCVVCTQRELHQIQKCITLYNGTNGKHKGTNHVTISSCIHTHNSPNFLHNKTKTTFPILRELVSYTTFKKKHILHILILWHMISVGSFHSIFLLLKFIEKWNFGEQKIPSIASDDLFTHKDMNTKAESRCNDMDNGHWRQFLWHI